MVCHMGKTPLSVCSVVELNHLLWAGGWRGYGIRYSNTHICMTADKSHSNPLLSLSSIHTYKHLHTFASTDKNCVLGDRHLWLCLWGRGRVWTSRSSTTSGRSLWNRYWEWWWAILGASQCWGWAQEPAPAPDSDTRHPLVSLATR